MYFTYFLVLLLTFGSILFYFVFIYVLKIYLFI